MWKHQMGHCVYFMLLLNVPFGGYQEVLGPWDLKLACSKGHQPPHWADSPSCPLGTASTHRSHSLPSMQQSEACRSAVERGSLGIHQAMRQNLDKQTEELKRSMGEEWFL